MFVVCFQHSCLASFFSRLRIVLTLLDHIIVTYLLGTYRRGAVLPVRKEGVKKILSIVAPFPKFKNADGFTGR
jgi:hypothetical protein